MYRYDPVGVTADSGLGDSSGSTAFVYILNPNLRWIKDSILRCVKVRDDSFVQLYRYPEFGADTMSRDHVAAIILALYVNRDYAELKFILENLPWKLSRKYSQTVDFWLWHRFIYADITGSWKAKHLANAYFILNIVLMSISVPINWLIRKILRIKPVNPGETSIEILGDKSTWKRKVTKLIFPDYAMSQLIWQLRPMPKNILKKILANILLIDIPKQNVVLKYLLTGKKIKPETVETFKPHSISWFRYIDTQIDFPSWYLNKEEYEFNDLNLMMLNYCYWELDKIFIDLNPINLEKIKNNENILISKNKP